MRPAIAVATLLLGAAAHADVLEVEGTLCRANRHVDRLIVDTGATRHQVALGASTRVAFEGQRLAREDLRPGERIAVLAEKGRAGVLQGLRIDVQARAGPGFLDVLLGTRPRLIGRFGVREAQTEFFTLHLPGDEFVRVDAKAAYGPRGRVRVSTLKIGDLLSIDGEWVKEREIRASSIHVITDDEPGDCRRRARKGETREQTEAREAAERRFLDGYDPEEGAPEEPAFTPAGVPPGGPPRPGR
jgi:hypothetical protein